MDASRPLHAEDLVAQLTWVRRLAAALVREAGGDSEREAEDVAQEALRVTLEQPAGRIGAARLRAWLRGVVRRLVVDRRRADVTRLAREHAVAPREPQASTQEVVERLAMQQRVAQAVRELAEPYRSTILYRYLDELETREVAARMGVDQELVRKRVQRGLKLLRERLDAEFGSDTKTWAGALLAATGSAAASVATKAAVAAGVLVAAFAAWQLLPSPPARVATGTTRTEDAAAAVAADAPPAEPPPPLAAARAPAADPAALPAVATPTHLVDGIVVHVHVVAHDRSARTAGRLVGHWYDDVHFGPAGPLQRIDAAITGATTDVVLPRSASNLKLAAVTDADGASVTKDLYLGPKAVREDRRRPVEHPLTIEIGDRVAGPRLTGEILVDEVARVPRGLEFQFLPDDPDPTIETRIDVLAARFEAGPLVPKFDQLRISSDETVPVTLPLTLGTGDAALDVSLVTGRTLRLAVVDVKDGRPLPGLELYVSKRASSKSSDFQSHYVVTDGEGRCEIRGLPFEGRFEVRHDARLVVRGVPPGDPEPRRYQFPPDPLFELALTSALPDVIERTIRIDPHGAQRRVTGLLAPPLLEALNSATDPAQLRFSSRSDGGNWRAGDVPVACDERGAWQVEASPGSDVRVWVERQRLRISNVASAHVDADDAGPLELAPRSGRDLLLRVVHGSGDGLVRVIVPDPERADEPASSQLDGAMRNGTFEGNVRLDGPATLYVLVGANADELRRAPWRPLDVDPATAAIAVLDLARFTPRKFELTLSSGASAPDGQLLLLRVEDGRPRPDSMVRAELVGGRSREPVAIEEGRYVYRLVAENAAMLVCGCLDVTNEKPDDPIAIECAVASHHRTELGAGIEFTKIGEVVLEGPMRQLATLRFAEHPALADSDAIFLPVGAEFSLLQN
jgi:RNA polymerase sigma-70 factor (ECF subfamily)